MRRRKARTTAELLILFASYYQSYAGYRLEVNTCDDSGKIKIF